MPEETYQDSHVFIGIKPEKLKNVESESNSHISKFGRKIGVSDCLLFSTVEEGMTDDSFLHSFICKNGIDAIKYINGDYAGAIWDEQKQELILYRDHVGVRPLFYYQDKDKVIFSSDIRGITSIRGVDTSIDENWIYYTVTGIYSPSVIDTEYTKIKCVPPGGYVKFKFSEKCLSSCDGRYWIPGEKKIRLKNRKAYTEELRRLVTDAVKIRADATNCSIGAELSGGLDSGVIALLLANMGKDCFYYSWTPGKDVLPYAENDERLVIDDICKKAGINCNYGGLNISFNDHKQMRNKSPLHFGKDEEKLTFQYKYAFPQYVNTVQIYETAATMQENGVRIVFTGHSGDEGISHRANPYELFYHHEYYRYFRLMFSRSSISKHRLLKTIKLIFDNQKLAKEELLKPISADEGGYSILNKSFVKALNPEEKVFVFAYDPKEQIRRGGIRNRLDVLAFFAASTGVRYVIPYADYRVIDFALGIPRYLYFNWYKDRFIFREAFKDLMPDSLYRVKDKVDHSYDSLDEEKEDSNKEIDEEELRHRREAAIKGRKELLTWLDKEYWGKYLDYDVLDDWSEMKSNPEYDEQIRVAICKCIIADFMVKRSKQVEQG
jgi:asparagine synthase (glutamine-hydrolysing)